MDIAEVLANLAEIDLSLPYSLVCDAWDMAGDQPITRETFEFHLERAIGTYNAIGRSYTFNPKALIP